MKRAILFALLLVCCVFSYGQQIEKAQRDKQDDTQEVIQDAQGEKSVTQPQKIKKPIQKKVKKPQIKSKQVSSSSSKAKYSEGVNTPKKLKVHKPVYILKKHKPYHGTHSHHVHYSTSIQYHYLVPPMYLYRGVWIRWWVDSPNGFLMQDGYPYYAWNGYLHRYSSTDEGSYDVVDSYTDEVYATFYGINIQQSYDRAAEMRDILNYREKANRYFCAERFEYDSQHQYDWDPDDYPDWLWE